MAAFERRVDKGSNKDNGARTSLMLSSQAHVEGQDQKSEIAGASEKFRANEIATTMQWV